MKIAVAAIGSFLSFGLALGTLHGGTPIVQTPLAGPNSGGAGASRMSGTIAAQPMSGRAAKAVLKTARASLQSGRTAEALRQYESVIASTPATEQARGEALYWAGFLRVSPDPALRDIDRARAYLGELKVFHGESGNQEQAAILLALTEEIADADRMAATLRTDLATRARETEACRAEKEAVNGKLQAALGESETLKESDSALHAEIQGLRDEVKRKDEALRKVKEVVVGWKAPR
jgi:hypothetical protein